MCTINYIKSRVLVVIALLLILIFMVGCRNSMLSTSIDKKDAETGTVSVKIPTMNTLLAESLGIDSSSTSSNFQSRDLNSKAFVFATRIVFTFSGDGDFTREESITTVTEPGMFQAQYDIPEGDYELHVEVFNSNVSSTNPVVEGHSIDINGETNRHFTVTAGSYTPIQIGCTPTNTTALSEGGLRLQDTGVTPFQVNLNVSNDVEIGSEHWFDFTTSGSAEVAHLQIDPSKNAFAFALIYEHPMDPPDMDTATPDEKENYYNSFFPVAMAQSAGLALIMNEDGDNYDLPPAVWGEKMDVTFPVKTNTSYWVAVALISPDGTTTGDFSIEWNEGFVIETFDEYTPFQDDGDLTDGTLSISGIQSQSSGFTDITTFMSSEVDLPDLYVTNDAQGMGENNYGLSMLHFDWWEEDYDYDTFLLPEDVGSTKAVLPYEFTSNGILLFNVVYEASGRLEQSSLNMWVNGTSDDTTPVDDTDWSYEVDRPNYEDTIAVDVSAGNYDLNWIAKKAEAGYTELVVIDNIVFIPDN